MQKHSPIERAKQIVEENSYMTIATSSLDGKPWISPVAFGYDNRYNLFWVSNKNAYHSSLIRINPRVAITIFDSKAADGEADAVYFDAKAVELADPKDLEHAIEILSRRVRKDEFRVKSPDQVIGIKVWRIYRATPIVVHKLVEAEHIDGEYVDKHIEIDLTTGT